MGMAHRHVIHAAPGQLRLGHGIINSLPAHGTVNTQYVRDPRPLFRRRKSRQHRRADRIRKGCAPNPQVQRWLFHAGDSVFPEQMYVFRQPQPVIYAPRPIKIMVARRNEHRNPAGAEHGFHRLHGFRINPLPVKQIPGQEHGLTAMFLHQSDQPGQNFPLLFPPPGSQFRRKSVKGRIQMQVRRV